MGIEVTTEGVGDENDIWINGFLMSDFYVKLNVATSSRGLHVCLLPLTNVFSRVVNIEYRYVTFGKDILQHIAIKAFNLLDVHFCIAARCSLVCQGIICYPLQNSFWGAKKNNIGTKK